MVELNTGQTSTVGGRWADIRALAWALNETCIKGVLVALHVGGWVPYRDNRIRIFLYSPRRNGGDGNWEDE